MKLLLWIPESQRLLICPRYLQPCGSWQPVWGWTLLRHQNCHLPFLKISHKQWFGELAPSNGRFSSSYTDAAPLACHVPQSSTLGPRLIFFLHLHLCFRGVAMTESRALDLYTIWVLTPTFGHLLGGQQTRSIRFPHRMLRGWEAWSWRRESVQSSGPPVRLFRPV